MPADQTAYKKIVHKMVKRELLSEQQAIETAEMLLYKNAMRLYKISDL